MTNLSEKNDQKQRNLPILPSNTRLSALIISAKIDVFQVKIDVFQVKIDVFRAKMIVYLNEASRFLLHNL